MLGREVVMGEMDKHEHGSGETAAGSCKRTQRNQNKKGIHLQSMSDIPPLQAAGILWWWLGVGGREGVEVPGLTGD
jgi:hypothetical protein